MVKSTTKIKNIFNLGSQQNFDEINQLVFEFQRLKVSSKKKKGPFFSKICLKMKTVSFGWEKFY